MNKTALALGGVAIIGTLMGGPLLAQATNGTGARTQDAPLSAIDWLSQSVQTPATPMAEQNGVQPPQPDPSEAPVANTGAAPQISVQRLDLVDPDAVGLLPPSVTGLPADLWAKSQADTLALLIAAESADTLPMLRDFFISLMVAQADPPQGTTGNDHFYFARVDRLLDLGALEPAQALLEAADLENNEIFRRWFDVTLLTGTENDACEFMDGKLSIAPTWPARIFCLARRGDWNAAALTLSTARALREITPEDEALLTRFLDDGYADGLEPLPPPTRVTPLEYRLREALGEPLPANGLPRAFAHADMREVAPWRSQLEAAERLARVGAVTPNVLFALYTRERPSASGGIWDRASAIRALDAALAGEGDLNTALPRAYHAMQAPRAEVAFSEFYGEALQGKELTGEAQDIAWRMDLLSTRYEAAALTPPEGKRDAEFLAAVARGHMGVVEPRNARQRAIHAAFTADGPTGTLKTLIDDGKLGEALLRTLANMAAGLESDPMSVTEGIALLRMVGLEDVARRTALQYLLLDRET